MACPNCGSINITTGIKLISNHDHEKIGLEYKTMAVFSGTAPVYCDLCTDCGEITRFYITTATNKNWRIKKTGN